MEPVNYVGKTAALENSDTVVTVMKIITGVTLVIFRFSPKGKSKEAYVQLTLMSYFCCFGL